MRQRRFLIVTLAVVALVAASWLFTFLATPRTNSLDSRVRDVASQLKCLVCQGETVADSPAPLAQQMRGVIRQQLQAGRSEQEVVQYFVDRYGDRILESPPWQGFTVLAWLVPIALLVAGAFLLFFLLRGWHSQSGGQEKIDETENVDEAELEEFRAQIEEDQEIELDFQLGNLAETDYRSLRERYLRHAFMARKARQGREHELDELIEEQLRQMKENDEIGMQ